MTPRDALRDAIAEALKRLPYADVIVPDDVWAGDYADAAIAAIEAAGVRMVPVEMSWRPIAEWDAFAAEWDEHTTRYWKCETDAPIASWVALGSPGNAENENEPHEDQTRWVFACIEVGEPLENLFVTRFPLSLRRKSGGSVCRCMNHFWDDMEICAAQGDEPAKWRDIMMEEHAEIRVKDVLNRWDAPFTHFCPVILPPVPGTPHAHNATVAASPYAPEANAGEGE